MQTYEPNVIGLGIKTLVVSPSDNLMAAGLFDGNIALYNHKTSK